MVLFKEIQKARFLRKKETKTEELLWEMLRNNNLGVKFRRQHPIAPFVIDFYCTKYKLAIEVDGIYHSDTDAKEYDLMRTEHLKAHRIYILRFWNNEIENSLPVVIKKIKEKLEILKNNKL